VLVGRFTTVTNTVLVTVAGGGEEGTDLEGEGAGVGDMEGELDMDDGYGRAGVPLLSEGVFS
jgi:hypothetical protein